MKPTYIQRYLALAGLLLTLLSCRSTAPEPDLTTAAEPPAASIPASSNLPPPPPVDSYLGQLSPDITNQLVDLEIDIVIPTYLPPTTSLVSYGVQTQTAETGPQYWLIYRDDQNRCFAIEYAAGGIGGIALENQEPLNVPLFGNDYSLYHGKFPNGSNAPLPDSDLFTDWLKGKNGFYRLIGAGLINAQDYGQKDCRNLPVEEAIAIAESLSYLPTDIRTLDFTTPDQTNDTVGE